MELLHPLKGMRPGPAVHKLLQDLAHFESGAAFCAHLLSFLILYVRGLGKRTAQLTAQLVSSAPGTEMRLTLFVGVVAGTAIQTLGQSLSVELADMLGRFLDDVRNLDPREKEMLVGLLDSALAESV
ncbi:MAG: hypothetical protein IMX01_10645 [Limnochordaceae bacterium]|nr:hypothetical protein [Limnochordaceae bacterium]